MKIEFNVADTDVCRVCNILFEFGKEEAENILAAKSFVSKHVIVQVPKVDVCNAVISAILSNDSRVIGIGGELDTIKEIEAYAKESDYPNALQFDDYNFVAEYAVYFVLNNIKDTLTSMLGYYNVYFLADEDSIRESIIFYKVKKHCLKNKNLTANYTSHDHKTKFEFAQKVTNIIGGNHYAFVSKILNVLNPPIDNPQEVADFIKNEMR